MDRQGVIGLFLIAIILIAWQFLAGPSADEIREQQSKADSAKAVAGQAAQDKVEITENDSALRNVAAIDTMDSALMSEALSVKYGDLAFAASGQEEIIEVKTPLITAHFSTAGGRLVSVQLNQYHTHDSQALYLFDRDSSFLDFQFPYQNRKITASELFFDSDIITGSGEDDSTVVIFRAKTGTSNRFIEQRYTFPHNNYMADYSIRFAGLEEYQRQPQDIALGWVINTPRKEKGHQLESATTTFFFKTNDDDVDYLSETSDDEEIPELPITWVSFKQQFFSVGLIPKNPFEANSSELIVRERPDNGRYVKTLGADLSAKVENGYFPMQLYLGPNRYKTLRKYDLDLDRQIDLGWGIFGWVNRFLVIPVFNLLHDLNISYGIVILILTLFIKIILFPITYKTYMSSAKMRALKPEMEELNEKYKNRDQMEKQQAVMKLYRETGVNPLAGCIPMLIQLPILYAMFRFFPASIELRQKSFLWADDLSSYDVILDLSQWGIDIPLYGSHISGFTLLMSISMIFYTKYNSQMNMGASGMQAQQMKIMMWMMPIMMMVFLNNYSSGLSLYYLTANVVTMVQQWVIKTFFIDEEKIHAKLQENKTKPKKKSRLMKQMEKIQEQQSLQQNRQMRRRTK